MSFLSLILCKQNLLQLLQNLQLKCMPWNHEMLITLYIVKRVEREEAKIAVWENLQKAKAEAAIQKLVVCASLYFWLLSLLKYIANLYILIVASQDLNSALSNPSYRTRWNFAHLRVGILFHHYNKHLRNVLSSE